MKKITLALILISSILICLNVVNAETNVTECGTILNATNTIYTLNQSINAWNTGDCIAINATNVTLDCQGYTITYGGDNPNYYAIGNADGYDNITIKNCIINQNGSAPAQHAISFERSENAVIFNNTITTLGGLPSIVNGSYGIYLNTNSTNANITSNTINTSGTYGVGIFLDNSGGNIVNNNVILTSGDYASGCYLYSSLNSNLTSNNITTSGGRAEGIFTNLNSSFSLIYNNIINTSGSNYSDGIYLYSDTNNVNITSNTIIISSYSGYGIWADSKNNTLSSNIITTSSYNGMGVYLANNLTTVYGNTITTTGIEGYGIYIMSASNNNLTNNIINTTDAFSIFVYGSSIQDYNHTIINNTEQGENIYYIFNNNSGIIENKIVGEIMIVYSNNVTLNNLTFDKSGIVFDYSNNSLVKNSNLIITRTGVWGGLLFGNSHHNNITNNTIITSGVDVDGIYFEGATNSTFTQNTIQITGNGSFVIYSSVFGCSSENNTFYNNLFNASTINSLSTSGFGYGWSAPDGFVWNTTKTAGTNIVGKSYIGGNYWTNNNSNGYSDTCIDSDGDYICDESYNLNTSNIDYLPLTMSTNAISGCTTLNTENKIYYLNQSFSATGTCFNITANNITLNLGGYNITGGGIDVGINITGNNTAVLNGSFYNFSKGISILSSSNTFNNIIINGSEQDAIYLEGTNTGNNNFTDVTVTDTNSSYYDLKFATAGINGTWLTDTSIASYNFTGIGGTVNIKISGLGMVEFLEPINGSGTNFTIDDINLGSNLIFVNSSNKPGLNRSAKITFYGIGLTESKPQYSSDNNVWTDCTTATNPICNIISSSGTTPVFNVSHFTYFKVAEAYTAPVSPGGGSSTTYQCNDNKDNDGDGLIDYPDDPGCVSRYDNNEFDIEFNECSENWVCSSWTECNKEGKQVRTCVDNNDCNTTKNKPAIEKICVTESSLEYDLIGLGSEKEEVLPQTTVSLKNKIYYTIFIILGIVLIASLILFLIIKRKKYFMGFKRS